MEASAAARLGAQALRKGQRWLRIDKARLLLLCPVLLSFVVWRDLPEVYFISDDFIDMKNIANDGALNYFVSPFAGHMIFTRNVEVMLMYALFGLEHPEAYGWLMLATHLLNVALFFRLSRTFSGSPELAALVASLWGACPLYSEALAWPAVYGQVLCATFLLLVLNGVAARQASASPMSVRDALRWASLLLLGATCFGGGIAIALIFPLLLLILLERPLRPRNALLTFSALPLVVLALYFGTQWIYALLDAVPPDQKMMQALAFRSLGPPLKMFGYLFAVGTSGLLSGFGFSPDGYPRVTWWLVIACGIAVATALVAGDKLDRRRLVALAAAAGAIYAMIAVGRANAYNMFGVNPLDAAKQLRYHYNSTVPVTLLVGVALGRLLRPLRSEKPAAILLGGWVLANGYLYVNSSWAVNTHADCRRYVESALLEIDRRVDEQPVGAEVRIRNEELPRYCTGFFGYDAIPGWATLFLISNPENELRGRRVVFVEDTYRERSGRLATLLVATSRPETRQTAGTRAEDITPSRHQACRDLQEIFTRVRTLRGCKSDGWADLQPTCEAPFDRKTECIHEFLKVYRCVTEQPAATWSCDNTGQLSFGHSCSKEMAPFLECMNE